jgi:DNA repair exonuclease SbcCD ATPase subunit
MEREGNMTDNITRKKESSDSRAELTVRNIGGIADAQLDISDGVTLLSGRNASNKSSTLRALAGVLGGPLPPLKNDAETGMVRLTVADKEYELQLERRDGQTFATHSDLYSSAEDRCELFVSLTETNPIRQAILGDDDIYDLLMRPVDISAIRSEINRLRDRKDTLDDRLAELDTMENRLPGLRSRRQTLQEEKAELESDLRSKRAAVEELEDETDDVTDELKEKREERNEMYTRLRTEQNAIESLESELDDIKSQLSEHDSPSEGTSVEEISTELDRLHQQKQALTSTINALSPIVEMNKQFLDDEADIPETMTDNDVTAELNPDSRTVDCWTCGSTVEEAQISEQVDAVEDIIVEKRNQRDTITSRIQSLTEQRRTIESHAEKTQRLQQRREDIMEELDERRTKAETLQSDLRALEADIEDLQRTNTDDSDQEGELQALYDDISDLEYERGRVANDLESVTEEIDKLESEVVARGDIEAERESVATDLREQRERIERIERDLVNTFNEMMQTVLDALDYDAIERIWLERRADGNEQVTESAFELHVVRANQEGRVYDDTIESLSKSEREVIGLIVALAGYLVHDVGESVPFLVVDAVEMFDAERIDGLMELFGEHAEYVVAAILPEEAYELEGDYDTVSTQSFAGTP